MRLNLTIERRDPATGEYFDPWHDGYDYDEDNPFEWSVRGWWYNSRLRRALRRAWDRVRGRKPYKPGVAAVVWFKSGMMSEAAKRAAVRLVDLAVRWSRSELPDPPHANENVITAEESDAQFIGLAADIIDQEFECLVKENDGWKAWWDEEQS